MGAGNKRLRAARAALKELYDRLPALECKGLCQASCGPIDLCVGPAERAVAGGMTLSRATEVPIACPMLTVDGKCSVYDKRPYICRAWGVIDHPDMRCPWGCRPRRYLTQEEGLEMLRRLQEIEDRYESQD